ncbi:hypothetical protein SY89_01905 [Halolamina pelagica]|jgi:hypothetical protein|uniref:Uncharacterized protein n=1 Tax=Halolamina pelagica TaxID=699431 RepID=A0A0P7HW05_9EURY|nr:hypothetical protein [Halolamina pelagica]KPN31162.1 hypothetical protein SY89_01905 [Halolamina pelagica]
MSELAAEPIHTALADRLGTALRGVIVYDGKRIDESLRADVAAQYSESEIRSFVDNSIVHQLDAPTVEESFRLGSLEAVVRTFERSWVARVADGAKRGCLFSVERDDNVSMAAVEDGIDIVQNELRK